MVEEQPYGNSSGYITNGTTTDGLVNWDAVTAYNTTISGGVGADRFTGAAIRSGVNNHQWYGLVSNFEYKLNDFFTFNVGADLRRYTGDHFRQFTDFLGLSGWNTSSTARGNYFVNQSYKANPWTSLWNYADESQRISWDYSETIQYAGVFGQVEYTGDYLSAYFQGAVSTQSHDRVDRYQYTAGNQNAEQVVNNGYNVKGGLNYKINENHSIFANIGKYSRQPYHDNIYLNYGNAVNPFTKNEDILGIEAGYQFRSSYFDANLNAYRTSWKNRVTTTSRESSGVITYTVNEAVAQLHQGVEFDFRVRPMQMLNFNGFVSVGKWEYEGDIRQKIYNEDQVLQSESIEDVDGGKVGDSPQFQVGLGLVFRPVNRFKFDVDWKYNDNLYANVVAKENLELPSYNLFDAGISYEHPLDKGMILKLRLNINNVLNTEYLAESADAIQATATTDNYKGINVDNRVNFGLGRTFNISATFTF